MMVKRGRGSGLQLIAVLLLALAMEAEMLPVSLGRKSPDSAPLKGDPDESKSFRIVDDQFVLDDVPIRILSGELHYFRIPRIYWSDRLRRVKAMGFNAIQTYVPWNYHEPRKGKISFEGDRDFAAFLTLANELELMVLLRPGPYICAEWDWGGLPAWLLSSNKDMRIRTYDPDYIAAVDAWWGTLLPLVVPLLRENGGPVVMVQIENEYGSYGDVSEYISDKRYLKHLVDLARKALGPNVVLYTTDFGNPYSMLKGSLNGSSVLTLGDFGPGSNVSLSLEGQAGMNPPGMNPPMCSEYYSGWYTYWGQQGATNTSTKASVKTLSELLRRNMSVSMYMAHGGTNFGTWAGANVRDGADPEDFIALVTSYDYSAPISEQGRHNIGLDGVDKFALVKSLLSPLSATPPPPEPASVPTASYGRAQLKMSAALLESIDDICGTAVTGDAPLPMELIAPDATLVMYTIATADLSRPASTKIELDIRKVHDRAHVVLRPGSTGSDELVGILERRKDSEKLVIQGGPVYNGKKTRIDIIVEAMGRTNYGLFMGSERKGITESVVLGGKPLTGLWAMFPISLATLPRGLQLTEYNSSAGFEPFLPTFFGGSFDVQTARDTFLSTRGWGHGFAFVNGFNLGRYWDTAGPVHTLYVPASLLRAGLNDVVLLEMDAVSFERGTPTVEFVDEPIIDPPAPRMTGHNSS